MPVDHVLQRNTAEKFFYLIAQTLPEIVSQAATMAVAVFFAGAFFFVGAFFAGAFFVLFIV